MLMCNRILLEYMAQLRAEVHALMTPPPAAPAGQEGEQHQRTTEGSRKPAPKPRPPPLTFMVNFDDKTFTPLDIQRATLVHLDAAVGDMRQIQSILRALAFFLYNENFAQRLDMVNLHLIPFSNGVLDMKTCQLRRGQHQDMVMRGPTYAWQDFDAGDVNVEYTEKLVNTFFPDSSVRDFVMDVCASLLVKRNRFKHFYIFTGNTNGGKSMFLSLLQYALGVLYGILPLAALTGRQSDPSSHNDYLARTQGLCMCVVNEPDSATQQIYPDAAKVLTSDTDMINVRELYGATREMSITWKLFMACNTPPTFADRGAVDKRTRTTWVMWMPRCTIDASSSPSSPPSTTLPRRARSFSSEHSTSSRIAIWIPTAPPPWATY